MLSLVYPFVTSNLSRDGDVSLSENNWRTDPSLILRIGQYSGIIISDLTIVNSKLFFLALRLAT